VWILCLNLIKSDYNWILLLIVWCFYKNIKIILIYFLINIDSLSIFWIEKTIQVSNSLTNGFFLIHPIFIFFTYSTGIIILFSKNKYTIILYIIFSITAITLGSWWANQELGWGGWWSWDYVEIINFMLVLIGLIWIHENSRNIKMYFNYINMIYLFVFFHMSVRYDFFNSIHSFTSSFNVEYKYIYMIILIILIKPIFYRTEFNFLDINLFLIKLLFMLYLFKISFFYKYNWLKNEVIWYNYLTTMSLIISWIVLKCSSFLRYFIFFNNLFIYLVFEFKNIFDKIKFNLIHNSFLILIMIFFINNQIDLTTQLNNKIYFNFYNISDFFILKKNTLEIWYNVNIINLKNVSTNSFIPLYNYSVTLKSFLTSNHINLSLYNYYFDVIILLILVIIIELVKNIMLRFNKYKTWCI